MEGKMDFIRVLASYFIPPLGVFLQVGLGLHFWLNIVLTLLGGVPGVLHALWVISTPGPSGQDSSTGVQTFVALILAAFLPPLAVVMRRGVGLKLLINCVLCLLFWLPGVLHAVWVVCNAQQR